MATLPFRVHYVNQQRQLACSIIPATSRADAIFAALIGSECQVGQILSAEVATDWIK